MYSIHDKCIASFVVNIIKLLTMDKGSYNIILSRFVTGIVHILN